MVSHDSVVSIVPPKLSCLTNCHETDVFNLFCVYVQIYFLKHRLYIILICTVHNVKTDKISTFKEAGTLVSKHQLHNRQCVP